MTVVVLIAMMVLKTYLFNIITHKLCNKIRLFLYGAQLLPQPASCIFQRVFLSWHISMGRPLVV